VTAFLQTLTPRTVFLLDAAGAFFSIILLALVLPAIESVIGMPYRVLYMLAGLAGVLLAISTACYIFAGRRWKPLLVAIALGNLAYCLLTAAAIVWFNGDLTTIGKVYFAGEIVIIFSIASFELLYAFRKRPAI
jgi:hypothetical protein